MKFIKSLIFIILIILSRYAVAQTDSIKMVTASNAIKNIDYEKAIHILKSVSDTGKGNKTYLYLKGDVYYNLLMYDSAEVYLEKYALLDSTNKDVSEKLNDIFYKRKKYIKMVAFNLLESEFENQKNNNKECPVEYDFSLIYISADSGNVNCMVFFHDVKKIELKNDKIVLYTFGERVFCSINNSDCMYKNSFIISSCDSIFLKKIYIPIIRLSSINPNLIGE